jgi:hypothetical protein
MASQRRGNGMGAEASKPQDVEQGHAGDRAPLRLTSRENDKAVLAAREAAGKASRPGNGAERLEKIESRRGNGMASKASDLQDMVHGCAAGRARIRLMGRENDKVVWGRPARVAREFARNVLKRLNPGSKIVVCREPRTHKIWYTGARLNVRVSGRLR